MRTMRNVRAQVALAAGLALAAVAGLCPSAQGAYVDTNNPQGLNMVLGFTEFNHIQMRLDLPGATFNWLWHPGNYRVHRDAAGVDVGGGAWTESYNGVGADGKAYVIKDFIPDGEHHANDYSWGDEIAFGIVAPDPGPGEIDLANTQFTINFNLYATDGSTSTGGAGTQSLRKSFDLIHYANNTWSYGPDSGNWYYPDLLGSGGLVPLGPTGEYMGWYNADDGIVGGGTWNPGYLTSAPVPEPTGLAVLAATSLLALRRRAV